MSWVDFTGQTPFLRAALSGDTTMMRLLLEHGADPNLATPAGTTPLMAAAGVNWVVAQTYTESPQALLEAVKLCLEHGADVNAVNSMGLTALLGAANRGVQRHHRLLVANGARLDVIDKEGRTPLRWAEGVFLAAVGAELKPATIALLEELSAAAQMRSTMARRRGRRALRRRAGRRRRVPACRYARQASARPAAAHWTAGPRHALLRDVPQRRRESPAASRSTRSTSADAAADAADVGEGDAQAAHRHDAAARRSRGPDRATLDRLAALARGVARRAAAAQRRIPARRCCTA